MATGNLLDDATAGTPVPPVVLAGLVNTESSWNPNAVNPTSGARGLGQALPSTAANPGFGVPPLPPNASPEEQLRWSAQYLAARGKALGLKPEDWNNPAMVAQALRAYHGDTGTTGGYDYAAKVLGMDPASSALSQMGVGPYGAGMVANMQEIQKLQAQKSIDQAPAYQQMMDQYQKDRIRFDKAADDFKPAEPLKPPPPPQPSNPLDAFGSIASVFAMVAAAFSKQPGLNAMVGLTGALNGAKANDEEAYKRGYQQWKDQTEIAIQNHKLQADDMRQAMEMMQTDLASGVAMAKAVAAKTDDQIAGHLLENGMYQELAELQDKRAQVGMQMEKNAPLVQATMDLQAAQRGLDAAQKSGDPNAVAEAQTRVQAAKDYFAFVHNPTTASQDPGSKSGQMKVLITDNMAHGMSQAEATLKAEADYAKAQGAGKPGQNSNLTPDAIHDAAVQYNLTGQIPGGTRNKADLEAVLNKAAELRGETGQSPNDVVANQAGFKSGQSSLTNLTKLSDASDAQMAAANKELDLVQSLIPKEAQSINSNAINKWIQTGQTQFGDTEVPKYQAALISALDEYAKIINGSTGAAGSTDSARAQAAQIIPPGATSDQIKGIIQTIKQGMQYKTSSYRDQIKEIQGRMGSGVSAQPPAAAPSPPPVASPPAATPAAAPQPNQAGPIEGQTGVSKSGKPIVFQNGQWMYQQ